MRNYFKSKAPPRKVVTRRRGEDACPETLRYAYVHAVASGDLALIFCASMITLKA